MISSVNKREKIVQERFLDNEEAVLKRLRQVYDKSLTDITKRVSELDSSIDALRKAYDSVTDDEIGELAAAFLKNNQHLTPEEARETLQSMIQSKVYQKNYQTALKKEVGGILDTMHEKEFKTVSDYLKTCYEDGFIGTMFDLQGQGIPLCFPLDQEAMVRAVQLDSKISHGLYTRLGEDIAVLKNKITAQVSRGVATGMSYQQVARQLADYTNIGYNNAVRIARTEGHRVQVQSGMDACYKAKDKGANVVKQWDAALDKRTRESHAAVDGEIRELDEKFSNGLRFPGDPHGAAAEVINCRCALLQRARWALDDDELQTLKDRAEYFGLDKADTFDEYKKTYLKAAEQVKTEEKKPTFTPAKTVKEAEAFISQYVDDKQFGATGISYSGLSVESANEVNKALSGLYERFNLDKLGGVFVPKGNTKLGKVIDGATAAYAPIRKSLLLNKNALKNVGDITKSHAQELELVKSYTKDPASLVFKTKRSETITKASVKSGRATVPDNITDVINHEMGHSIESYVRKSNDYAKIKSNMPTYAENISGYATYNEGEYIAESFASYMKGEKLLDPVLEKVFESLKR